MGSMFSDKRLDAAIDAELEGKPRARTQRTEDLLRRLVEAEHDQFILREMYREAYADEAADLKRQGKSHRATRGELSEYERDIDSMDEEGALLGVWINKKVASLPASLEPTGAAALEAVIFGGDDKNPRDHKPALKKLEALAESDDRVVIAKAREIVRSFPHFRLPEAAALAAEIDVPEIRRSQEQASKGKR